MLRLFAPRFGGDIEVGPGSRTQDAPDQGEAAPLTVDWVRSAETPSCLSHVPVALVLTGSAIDPDNCLGISAASSLQPLG